MIVSQGQHQSGELLQLSAMELEAFVQELAMDNPMVEPVESSASVPISQGEEDLLGRLTWLEENDNQNRFYQQMGEEELEPLARVGTEGGLEETLLRFLSRQIHRMDLDEDTAQTVRYLAACLDDNGYFRAPLEELSENCGISVPRLERGLAILRTLEPAGVGAEDLSQCLTLQLRRFKITGPALTIAQDCLDLLAKRHYRVIAGKLGVSVEAVQEAEQIIRELEPRPGAVFQRPEQVPFILPDVFIEEQEGRFLARTRRQERPLFRINDYYRELLDSSDDQEVRDYLSAKLKQAEGVLAAVDHREATLLRCAQVIADRQSGFFRSGPQALTPLRLSDLAKELNLHESLVSRAIREKYVQSVRGVYPMNYFFTRSATADESSTRLGGTAARALLRRLIDEEDKGKPLSDQKLCERMAQENCPISRRTVAKYRKEMNIPGISGRKLRA